MSEPPLIFVSRMLGPSPKQHRAGQGQRVSLPFLTIVQDKDKGYLCHSLDQTRPKKFAEGGVYMRERAYDVPLSRIQACARGASLKRLRG